MPADLLADAIAARMRQIRADRETTQPVRARTGGSTFRNPPDMKAWELIDSAGCRGLRRGRAQVSEKHCNFLLNTGGATASDLEGLGEEVRRRVHGACGITLDWEIHRIGVLPSPCPSPGGRGDTLAASRPPADRDAAAFVEERGDRRAAASPLPSGEGQGEGRGKPETTKP